MLSEAGAFIADRAAKTADFPGRLRDLRGAAIKMRAGAAARYRRRCRNSRGVVWRMPRNTRWNWA
jgi:hypothetical protein